VRPARPCEASVGATDQADNTSTSGSLPSPESAIRKAGLVRMSFRVALNRCFPSKSVNIWHQLDDKGHIRLVERYLREAGNWKDVHSLDRSPRRLFTDPLYAVVGRSTGPCAHDMQSTPAPTLSE
jgi:hypothetical protein